MQNEIKAYVKKKWSRRLCKNAKKKTCSKNCTTKSFLFAFLQRMVMGTTQRIHNLWCRISARAVLKTLLNTTQISPSDPIQMEHRFNTFYLMIFSTFSIVPIKTWAPNSSFIKKNGMNGIKQKEKKVVTMKLKKGFAK